MWLIGAKHHKFEFSRYVDAMEKMNKVTICDRMIMFILVTNLMHAFIELSLPYLNFNHLLVFRIQLHCLSSARQFLRLFFH